MAKIYLASPFFNEAENNRLDMIEAILESLGHEVFSPRKNQLEEFEMGSYEWRTNVYRNDIQHIHWADIVLSIVTDNYDDTGTAFEIGYAHAIGKVTMLYNPTGNIINLMLTDSIHAYFESGSEILNYDFRTLPPKPYMKEVK